jgi:hypothetical protein
MAKTTDTYLLELASRLRASAHDAATIIENDNGDGFCVTDLEDAFDGLNAVIYETEQFIKKGLPVC